MATAFADATAQADTSFPVPKPTTKDDVGMGKSAELPISTSPIGVSVYGPSGYIDVTRALHAGEGFYFQPAFPTGLQLAYRLQWDPVATRLLSPGQTYTYSETQKVGISTTDSNALSGELGVSVMGLSGKLTNTTSHSIMLTEERDVVETYTLTLPENKAAVWTLWQLLELFVIVDAHGNEASYSGTISKALGPIFDWPVVLAPTRVIHRSIIHPDKVLFDP